MPGGCGVRHHPVLLQLAGLGAAAGRGGGTRLRRTDHSGPDAGDQRRANTEVRPAVRGGLPGRPGRAAARGRRRPGRRACDRRRGGHRAGRPAARRGRAGHPLHHAQPVDRDPGGLAEPRGASVGPVLSWREYTAGWSELHGGYDPAAGSRFVRGWLRLAYELGRAAARLHATPDAVTAVGLLVSIGVPLSVRVPVLPAVLVALSVVADTV